jgi:ABC-type sugar transport system ATPase subunit
LSEVSLVVRAGEIHAVCGENGAGKSTLMKVLSGVHPYGTYQGDIFYQGQECRFADIRASEHAGIVIIHQELALVPGMSITENIFLGNEPRRWGRIDWKAANHRALELMALVGLNEDPDTLVKDIGVGKQQLVEIAKAFAKDVRLLILDEPTAALDVDARRTFWERVHGYVSAGRTVLFATHRLEEADAVADRVVVISGGRLLADGTPDRVKAQAAGRSTISVAADGLSRELLENLPAVEAVHQDRGRLTLSTSDPDATVRALLQQAPNVQGLEVRRAGMEEAFLHLTHEEGVPS